MHIVYPKNKNVKLYCLSGLGVDKRAFQNLNPKGVELIHIDWIDPLKNETIAHYSRRLFDLVQPEDNYNLLGVSFGGMVATEFSKFKRPEKLFLVSTITGKNELSRLFKTGSYLKLHKLIPTGLMRKGNFLTYYFFGTKQVQDKKLLTEILRDTNPGFLKWALDAVVNWDNQEKPDSIKIHGSKDKILPLTSDVNHTIKNAGHFMIVTRGHEISQIVENIMHNK